MISVGHSDFLTGAAMLVFTSTNVRAATIEGQLPWKAKAGSPHHSSTRGHGNVSLSMKGAPWKRLQIAFASQQPVQLNLSGVTMLEAACVQPGKLNLRRQHTAEGADARVVAELPRMQQEWAGWRYSRSDSSARTPLSRGEELEIREPAEQDALRPAVPKPQSWRAPREGSLDSSSTRALFDTSA
jgi:hypothetical protein